MSNISNKDSIDFQRGRVTLYYKTNKDYILKFLDLLKKHNMIFKDSKNKFNKVISSNSKTQRFNISNSFQKNLTDSKNIKMHDIYVLEFFEKGNLFLENFIAFTISVENDSLILNNNYLDELISLFFEQNKIDIDSIDDVNLSNENFDSNLKYFAKYIEYYNEGYKIDDEVFKILIGGYKRVSKYNQQNFTPTTFKSNTYGLYVNKKYNICIEHKYDKNYSSELSQVCEFALALAYKNHYNNRIIQISEFSKVVKINEYESILNFALEIAQFESSYFFRNPTTLQAYDGFFEKLMIGQMQIELQSSLDRLLQVIGLMHNKNEAQRLEKEKKDKQIEKEQNELKVQKLNNKLNLIALIFTVLGGIGAIPAFIGLFG